MKRNRRRIIVGREDKSALNSWIVDIDLAKFFDTVDHADIKRGLTDLTKHLL